MSVDLSRDELHELLNPPARLSLLSHRRASVRKSAYEKLRGALEEQPHRVLADSFEDDRGRIQDLIDGPIDSVTRITTKKWAIRGNHWHERTTQWTYILSGQLLMANGGRTRTVGAGEMVVHLPGEPHAWQAVVDTDVLVFTRGPRSGTGYESDTFRLDEPLLA